MVDKSRLASVMRNISAYLFVVRMYERARYFKFIQIMYQSMMVDLFWECKTPRQLKELEE